MTGKPLIPFSPEARPSPAPCVGRPLQHFYSMKAHSPSTALVLLCAALLAPVNHVLASDVSNQKAADQLSLIKFALPEYPSYLQQIGLTEGTVAMAIERNAAGAVADVLVLESTHYRFSDAATEATKVWRFAPLPEGTPAIAAQVPIVRIQFAMDSLTSVLMPTIYVGRPEMPVRPDQIKVITFAELDRAPAAKTQPMPAFPAELARRGVKGTASVSFFVDPDGKVRIPVVTAADAPEFAEAALAAIRQWRFEAPRKGGKKVTAFETWTFDFGTARRDS